MISLQDRQGPPQDRNENTKRSSNDPRHFRLIHTGLDVAPILAELDANPQLWDEHTERRTAPGSPHAEMQDIWVRARAREELTTPEAFREPHAPVFYPAWHRLPSIQPVVWSLMASCKAVQLGQALITRIPPGGCILPHIDGGWAAEWFTTKFYCVLRVNARCVNTCLDEEVAMRAGEIWSFENRVTHGVENHGATDRVSLIVTLRCEA